MRISTAYFAGAGTVVAAIVGGVGGGLLIADIVSPKSPKGEMTRLERRMSAEPIQVSAAASQPGPYLAATQQATSGAVAVAPPQTQASSQIQGQTPATPVQAELVTSNSSQPAAAQPTDKGATAQPALHASTSAMQPAAREETAAADDSVAKARDTDMKRAAEKRRAERRQQWADRRRHQQRQEQELQAVEERVREETLPRREFLAEPVRIETRRLPLFGEE